MRIRFQVLLLLASLAPVSGLADQMQQPAVQSTPAMTSTGMQQDAMARPTGGCDPMCVGMMEKEKALFPG